MELQGLTFLRSGKVRDLYALEDDRQHLLLVASDRVSTYDHVHPTPIPDKGRILTALSVFWFEHLGSAARSHLVTADVDRMPAPVRAHADVLRGRATWCRMVEVIPFECVVRGHLAGSGWAEYRDHGTLAGEPLPDGLLEGSPLPEPRFTPATKAAPGEHDENVTFDELVAVTGEALAYRLRELSLRLFTRAREHAASVGLVLADTKLEFGLLDGEVVLADEAFTPDSSRYWPAEGWEPGSTPPSFDKQFVRDHVTASGWDRTAPAPPLPDDVVAATRARYVEAHDLLTGRPFDA